MNYIYAAFIHLSNNLPFGSHTYSYKLAIYRQNTKASFLRTNCKKNQFRLVYFYHQHLDFEIGIHLHTILKKKKIVKFCLWDIILFEPSFKLIVFKIMISNYCSKIWHFKFPYNNVDRPAALVCDVITRWDMNCEQLLTLII